jgi:hypothetical protein
MIVSSHPNTPNFDRGVLHRQEEGNRTDGIGRAAGQPARLFRLGKRAGGGQANPFSWLDTGGRRRREGVEGLEEKHSRARTTGDFILVGVEGRKRRDFKASFRRRRSTSEQLCSGFFDRT